LEAVGLGTKKLITFWRSDKHSNVFFTCLKVTWPKVVNADNVTDYCQLQSLGVVLQKSTTFTVEQFIHQMYSVGLHTT